MKQLRDWGDCHGCIAAVRRAAPAYTSNLYAPREKLERWAAAGRLRAVDADGATLLLRRDRDFDHLYHVAEDQAALSAVLAALPAGTYVSDLIGKDEALDQLCGTYVAAGFAHYSFLRRMSRVQAAREPTAGEAEVATPQDAEGVAALLDRLLDPYAEQVPDLEELRSEAEAGRLLLVRRGDAISGVLVYELKGRTAHLRFWHVDDTARGEGIGRRLMASFIARCAQAQRIVLWVIGDKHRSIAIYGHYGFAADGLLDRIMIQYKEPRP
jgi:ribosomal protein S18 acetylase RimI-like enzyme